MFFLALDNLRTSSFVFSHIIKKVGKVREFGWCSRESCESCCVTHELFLSISVAFFNVSQLHACLRKLSLNINVFFQDLKYCIKEILQSAAGIHSVSHLRVKVTCNS